MLKTALAAPVIALLLAAGAQAATRDQMLTTPAWVAEHAKDADLVILHVGDQAEFAAGHLPGAQLVTSSTLATTGPDGLVLEMPTADELHRQLQALGVSDNSRIVVYSGKAGLPAATRVLFTLQAVGLGDRAMLLDGGLAGWVKAGRPLATEASAPRAGKLSPLKLDAKIVDAGFVQKAPQTKGYDLIDARAPVYYDGVQPGGAQGPSPKKGHIPGAKNIPFSSVTDVDGKLKSADELAAQFKAAGVQPGDKVVVYCHVGQQATAVLFAARTLGIDALLYDGSFQDWAKRDLPVEDPSAGR